MSVRFKIILAFSLMALFLVAQALVGYRQNQDSRVLIDLAIHKNYEAVSEVNRLSILFQQLRRYEKEYFIYVTDPVKKRKYSDEWGDAFAETNDQLDAMIANAGAVFTAADVERFKAWREAAVFYGDEFREIVAHYASLNPVELAARQGPEPLAAEANGRIHEGKTRLGAAMSEAAVMGREKSSEAIATAHRIERNFDHVEMVSLALVGGAVVLFLILVLVLPASISGSLRRLVQDAERIGEGHLSTAVERPSVPEFIVLANALEKLRTTLLSESQRSYRPQRPAAG